jgi:hypothetical protein
MSASDGSGTGRSTSAIASRPVTDGFTTTARIRPLAKWWYVLTFCKAIIACLSGFLEIHKEIAVICLEKAPKEFVMIQSGCYSKSASEPKNCSGKIANVTKFLSALEMP